MTAARRDAVYITFITDGTDDPERDITQGEFDAMLTRLVALYKPEAMETWQNTSYAKEGDDASVFRFHGAIQLLYAAEAMDIATLPDGGYPTLDNQSVDWSAFWSMGWEETDGWSEDTFSEPSEAMTEAWVYDSEVYSHFGLTILYHTHLFHPYHALFYYRTPV